MDHLHVYWYPLLGQMLLISRVFTCKVATAGEYGDGSKRTLLHLEIPCLRKILLARVHRSTRNKTTVQVRIGIERGQDHGYNIVRVSAGCPPHIYIYKFHNKTFKSS